MPTPKKSESKQDFLKRCTPVVISEGNESGEAYAQCNALWDDAKGQRQALKLSMPVDFAQDDEGDKGRSFLITAYTGQIVEAWWRDIVIDVEGIKTKKKIPILREHYRDRVVGQGAAYKKDNTLFVSGPFSKKTKDAQEVLDLADEGYPWQASIGVRPKQVRVLESAKDTDTVNGKSVSGPLEIWAESQVGEVSFVSLGADDETAAISMTEDTDTVSVKILKTETKEIPKMDLTLELLKKENPELLKQIQDEAHASGYTEGTEAGSEAELNRVTQILEADADITATRQAITEGLTIEAAFKMFFEAEKGQRAGALKKLEEEATSAQGQEAPDETELDGREPDVILADKAMKLMDEKDITYDAAFDQVMAENSELAEKYNATYAV